jgi:hypothetical protein
MAPTWRKSTRCDSGSCVEVAVTDDGVAVRDSKAADGPILVFAPRSWTSFLAGIRADDFRG